MQLSEVVRNEGSVAAGFAGIVLGGLRVVAANRQASAQLKQADVARREHVAELFNRAVGLLDDDKLHVRMGAIDTLREVARDFPDLMKAMLELLATYLREWQMNYGAALPPADVREHHADAARAHG